MGIAIRSIRLATAVCALSIWGAPSSWAHGGPSLSGSGTAIIDGVMQPGEWDSAAVHSFPFNLPPEEGGTTAATILVMNDGQNLFLALRVDRDTLGFNSASFQFDNDHDGILYENGDDFVFIGSSSGFYDGVRSNLPPCSPGPAGNCGYPDTTIGGTNDGAGAVQNNGSFSFYEYAHPLDSADDLNDFSLKSGDSVGFFLTTSFCGQSSCAETDVNDGDILVTPPPPPLSVSLEVHAAARGPSFGPGQTFGVGIGFDNPGIHTIVDLIFGVVLPDGHTVLTFNDLDFHVTLGDLSDLASLDPIAENFDLTTPLSVSAPDFFTYTWNGNEPAGSYLFFFVAAVHGSLADHSVDPGDLVAFDLADLTFVP